MAFAIATMKSLPRRAWRCWPLVTLVWYACALLVVVIVKHEPHKALLATYGNGVISLLIVAPFALRENLAPLRANLKGVVVVSVLSALERNLTNASLYSIGAALKTALHGLNVVLTFFVAAACGVDPHGRRCLRGQCSGELDNILMVPVLGLISCGGLVTAVLGNKEWSSSAIGIGLQLTSNLCYAAKYTCVKKLLGDTHGKGGGSGGGQDQQSSSDSSSSSTRTFASESRSSGDGSDSTEPSSTLRRRRRASPPPSKLQIALVAQPITGLLGLVFLFIFETPSLDAPRLDTLLVFGLGVTGILVFELQLVQLTSPLTVAILSALHNVFIVLFFVLKDGEAKEFDFAQMVGFLISTVGIMGYALVTRLRAAREAAAATSAEILLDDGGAGAHIERSQP